MRARILSVRELSAADEKKWESLCERAAEPNPLFEPCCVIPAARHQPYGDEIKLAVAEDAEQFYACLPIRDLPRWKFVPYPVVTSTVRRTSYLGTPLVDATVGVEAMSALLTTMQQRRRIGRSRVLALEWLGADGPVEGFVRSAAAALGLQVHVWESFERGVLHRRLDGNYLQTSGRNLRHDLDRRRRRFVDEFGTEMAVIDRAGESGAIDDYIALEGAGYKADARTSLTTIRGEPEYFRDMCERFAATDRLVLPTIIAGGRPLAMSVWLRASEGLFMLAASYDERHARFAPGKELHSLAMNLFHNQTDAAWIDTCTFENNSLLLRLYPGRRRIKTLLIPLGRNPVDTLIFESLIAVRRVRRRLRGARSMTTAGIASTRHGIR